jgi:hypothetical protein
MRSIHNTASPLALSIGFMADETAEGGAVTQEADADNADADADGDDSKPKTVLSHMKSRSTFDNAADALAYLTRMSEECTDFAEYPGLTVGLTEDGAFDPEIYTDSMLVTVARLTEKGDKATGKPTKVVAIVVYPTPRVEAVMADAEHGVPWIAALIEKEANLIAMRALRRDDDLASGVDAMPKTLADYWTPASTAGTGTLATYNELWQAVRDATGEQIKAVKAAGLSKKQFRFALESASFARESFGRLESRKNKAGVEYSAFVFALHTGIALAKEEGLDPAFFENALATRNDKVIEVSDTGEDDIDLDFLTGEPGEGDGE